MTDASQYDHFIHHPVHYTFYLYVINLLLYYV